MIEEFRPSSLVDAAKEIGVNPFELVRLSVALDEPSEDLRFSAAAIAKLREKAGIRLFWAERELPDLGNPVESAVRGACGLLLDEGLVGDTTTRLDNLTRGLSPLQAEAIDEAIALLAEAGSIVLMTAPAGLQVAVVAGKEDSVRGVADGSNIPDELASLWAE